MKSWQKNKLTLAIMLGFATPAVTMMTSNTVFAATAETIIYVNPTASNNGDGSETSPYKDFKTALNSAPEGATLKLMSNVFITDGGSSFKLPKSVTIDGNNNELKVRGIPLELGGDTELKNLKLKLMPAGTVFEGFAGTTSPALENSSYIYMDGNKLTLNNVSTSLTEEGQHQATLPNIILGTKQANDTNNGRAELIIQNAPRDQGKIKNIYTGNWNSPSNQPAKVTLDHSVQLDGKIVLNNTNAANSGEIVIHTKSSSATKITSETQDQTNATVIFDGVRVNSTLLTNVIKNIELKNNSSIPIKQNLSIAGKLTIDNTSTLDVDENIVNVAEMDANGTVELAGSHSGIQASGNISGNYKVKFTSDSNSNLSNHDDYNPVPNQDQNPTPFIRGANTNLEFPSVYARDKYNLTKSNDGYYNATPVSNADGTPASVTDKRAPQPQDTPDNNMEAVDPSTDNNQGNSSESDAGNNAEENHSEENNTEENTPNNSETNPETGDTQSGSSTDETPADNSPNTTEEAANNEDNSTGNSNTNDTPEVSNNPSTPENTNSDTGSNTPEAGANPNQGDSATSDPSTTPAEPETTPSEETNTNENAGSGGHNPDNTESASNNADSSNTTVVTPNNPAENSSTDTASGNNTAESADNSAQENPSNDNSTVTPPTTENGSTETAASENTEGSAENQPQENTSTDNNTTPSTENTPTENGSTETAAGENTEGSAENQPQENSSNGSNATPSTESTPTENSSTETAAGESTEGSAGNQPQENSSNGSNAAPSPENTPTENSSTETAADENTEGNASNLPQENTSNGSNTAPSAESSPTENSSTETAAGESTEGNADNSEQENASNSSNTAPSTGSNLTETAPTETALAESSSTDSTNSVTPSADTASSTTSTNLAAKQAKEELIFVSTANQTMVNNSLRMAELVLAHNNDKTVWVEADYRRAKNEDITNRTRTVAVGINSERQHGVQFGIAAGYNRTQGKSNDYRAAIKSWHLLGYADYQINAIRFDLYAGLGKGSIKGDLQYKVNLLQAGAGISYRIGDAQQYVEPFMRADYVNVNSNLQEINGNTNSVLSSVGVRAKYTITDKFALHGHTSVGIDSNNKVQITQRLNDGSWIEHQQNLGKLRTQIGAAISYKIMPNVEINAGYDLTTRKNYREQSAKLSLKVHF